MGLWRVRQKPKMLSFKPPNQMTVYLISQKNELQAATKQVRFTFFSFLLVCFLHVISLVYSFVCFSFVGATLCTRQYLVAEERIQKNSNSAEICLMYTFLLHIAIAIAMQTTNGYLVQSNFYLFSSGIVSIVYVSSLASVENGMYVCVLDSKRHTT